MTIFYIKMKIRAGGGYLGQEGGALGQQGAPPCYSSLWETLVWFKPFKIPSDVWHGPFVDPSNIWHGPFVDPSNVGIGHL